MENPVAPPVGLAPDLDSIMQRIRDAVHQRSHPDTPTATLARDGNLYTQLEVVLREQFAANEAMLESFTQILGELRELQDHARHLGDARAQDSERQTEEIRELQEQVERNSDVAAVIARELDTI